MIISIVVLLASCKTSTVYTNFYTTIDRIYNVEPGMKMTEVNNALGVSPYELYLDLNTGNKIVVYLYTHRMQAIPMNKQDREEYLSNGREVYKHEGKIFAVFGQGDGKLISYMTQTGRNSGLNEMKWENVVRYVVENPGKYATPQDRKADQQSTPANTKRKRVGDALSTKK